VRFAGGHDPGPLALPEPDETTGYEEEAAQGPWGDHAPSPGGDEPFLPQQPPAGLGDPTSSPPGMPGPWGPRRN
jgi:heat shock protein HtpX